MAEDLSRRLDDLAPALKQVLEQVCDLVASVGGRTWLVGGCVRDLALGRPVTDLDLEVFGVPADRLQAGLAAAFEVDVVGRSFGILKLRHWPVDIGIPRRETKLGLGHRGFAVETDPHLDLPTAASRRDFTINAVYLDPCRGEVADPWGGLADLRRGVLRHTSAAFGEDPLRVLRAMQFLARFDLQVHPDTVRLCRDIAPEGLPGERVWGEWVKLLTLGDRPSRGLAFLVACDWLRHFPALAALPGVAQDPTHHPEGDVWRHTLHCLDAFAAARTGEFWEDLVVGCAVLCHDLGKAVTTTTDGNGRVRALGHEQESARLTEEFLVPMTGNRRLLAEVLPLITEHMRPAQLHQAGASDAAVRRLAVRVGRIDRLVRVARADAGGRPPLAADTFAAGDWLLEQAAALGVRQQPPPALVQGRDLVALGAQPGPHFATILAEIYEAQLGGQVQSVEAGLALAREILARGKS